MATSKKKTQEAVAVEAPKKKTATKKLKNVDSGGWPKMQQGTHLTVKTFEDGRTELVWDWDALVNEVREACASAELANMKPAVRAKVATRQKKAKA